MKSLLSMLAIFGLSACATTAHDAKLELDGSHWYASGNHYKLADAKLPAFMLSEQEGELHIAGTAGCNNFKGAATFSDNLLKTGLVGTTMKMCPPDRMKIEEEFLKALAEGLRYDPASDSFAMPNGEQILRKPTTN